MTPALLPFTARLAAVVLIAGAMWGVGVPRAESAETQVSEGASSSSVKAADLSTFEPGNIVSNEVFFASGTMTEAEIQEFLVEQVPACQSGYTCLKDWYDTSRTTSADAMCGAYAGGTRERASRIIYKVAQACGINPQVILVTLQKEQGLVTHTWPSEWRYTAAMGQGCPDTAACDSQYYGFFNQVFGAAWQFKRYANPSGTSQYFTWYAPGNTWNILYNPDRACGSSPVYVQNQATANLYYYTPYQPNAAAIRAGYGLGDSCSSYGNRNFFNYFTDWFGSTQYVENTYLVQSGNPVYLVSGSTRYLISKEDYPEFEAAFGTPRQVTVSYLETLTHGGAATRSIRNASTGSVSYLDGGERHLFTSCAQVDLWGPSCNNETRVTSEVYESVRSTEKMSSFISVDGTLSMYEGGVISPVYDSGTATILNGGTSPYAATMGSAVLAEYGEGIMRFAPGRFIRVGSSSSVRLPTTDGRLIGLKSWSHAAEFGLPTTTYRVGVAESAVAGFDQSEELSFFVQCGAQIYVPSQGTLLPVTSAAADGFEVTALDSAICAELTLSKATPLEKVFVQAAGSNGVYLATGGVFRLVSSRDVLMAINGDVWPKLVTISAATRSTLPLGDTITWQGAWEWIGVATGSVIRAQGGVSVYLVDGGVGIGLPNWGVGNDLGISSRLKIVDPDIVSALTPSEATLRPILTCDGTSWVGSNGALLRISSDGLAGIPTTELSSETCATLSLSGGEISGRLFVSSGGTTYVAEDGALRRVEASESLSDLNGGTEPTVVTWSAGSVGVVGVR